jgi:DNA polymerase-1
MTAQHLVVDGNNILMRAFHAAQHSQMSSGDTPTGALLIFVNLISKYVRQEQPDHLLVCWDGGRSTHRTAIFDGYKAARLDKPWKEDPEGPFGQAKEFLSLANIHHVEQSGCEADDLVAAYVREHRGRKVILSGDKDFLQLLDGWTEQIRPGGANERWTANRVRTEMGCKPEDIPKVMALTGDMGDNVPGVPGFGQKTACKALTAHDWDLDALRRTTDPKWAKKIWGYVNAIERNYALVNLRDPIPGVITPEAPEFVPTDPTSALCQALLEFLIQYQMESVKQRLLDWTLWSDEPMKEAS